MACHIEKAPLSKATIPVRLMIRWPKSMQLERRGYKDLMYKKDINLQPSTD